MSSADSNDIPLLKNSYDREDMWYAREQEASKSALAVSLSAIVTSLETILGVNMQVQSRLDAIHTNQEAIIQTLKEIKMEEAELKVILDKVDATTTKTGDNVQIVADVTQTISNEMDTLVTALKAGNVSPALVAQAQGLADRAQRASDALDAQVPILRAIAAKGAPVVPPPAPAPVV